MALDAAIHPQEYYYSMGYPCNKDIFTGVGSGGFDELQEQKGFVKLLGSNGMEQCCVNGNWEYLQNGTEYWRAAESSSPEVCAGVDHKVKILEGPTSCINTAMMEESPSEGAAAGAAVPAVEVGGKRKRQRTRACKNKEELENQRMTHIAVERNRRKQMNDYLSVIRSLMPPSYVQRGDQASIIGGAINFVKELEQHLQSLEAQKRSTNINPIHNNDDEQQKQQQKDEETEGNNGVVAPMFSDFFTFPQYSTSRSSQTSSTPAVEAAAGEANEQANYKRRPAAYADIEVSMAESHANLKILSRKRPRQLLKIVSGLQCLWFTILHLNVTTTFDQRVLYSISVKLEEGCQLSTADEIADAVNHLLGRIEEEAV